MTLIRHILTVALESQARPVIVVLGAAHEIIAAEIGDMPDVHLVINDGWQEGIASSIRMGITHLDRMTGCDKVILAVCDQPLIDCHHLDNLIAHQARGMFPVVASEYGDTLGTPALFDRRLFGQLLSLRGDIGARRIIANSPENIGIVPFRGGEKDIDTRQDLQHLLREQNS
jgi:molybdenum cofactor cytidylyltransferase